MNSIAAIFIYLACIFYTVGVFAEKRQGILKVWHLIVFWLGFLFDTIGTAAMGNLIGSMIQLDFHGITGLAAILVMLFHAAWATGVLIKDQLEERTQFHRLSFVVWLIWLIPMVTGMIFGVSAARGH